MNKKILVLASLLLCFTVAGVTAQTSASDENETAVEQKAPVSPWKYVAAALAVGFGCIGGGMAVAKIGSAAMGAMSENAELSGKALPFVGLAEGICLWGFLVGLLIIVL